MRSRSTPPCMIRSSSRPPTGLSAIAVTIAVRRPKHRRRPRATLYSPPPSETANVRVVAILPSPGSKRSITSPSATRSYLHSSGGRSCTSALLREVEIGADPRAAARQHRRYREVVGEVLRGDAPGGDEAHVREHGADAAQERRAADERGGEDLDHVAAERAGAVDLGRGRGAGDERQARLLRRVDHLG